MMARPMLPRPLGGHHVDFESLRLPFRRALAYCSLTPAEQVVMQRAQELALDLALMRAVGSAATEPLAFSLDVDALAYYSGFSRAKLTRALARLQSSALLLPAEHGLTRINLDFAAWTGPHALSDRQIQTADAGDHGFAHDIHDELDQLTEGPRDIPGGVRG